MSPSGWTSTAYASSAVGPSEVVTTPPVPKEGSRSPEAASPAPARQRVIPMTATSRRRFIPTSWPPRGAARPRSPPRRRSPPMSGQGTPVGAVPGGVSAGIWRHLRRDAPSLPDLSIEEAVLPCFAKQLVVRVRLPRVGHGIVGDGSRPRISLCVLDECIPAGCATPSTCAKLGPSEKLSHRPHRPIERPVRLVTLLERQPILPGLKLLDHVGTPLPVHRVQE